MYIHIYLYICIYINRYAYILTHIHTYMHTHTHTHKYTYIHIYSMVDEVSSCPDFAARGLESQLGLLIHPGLGSEWRRRRFVCAVGSNPEITSIFGRSHFAGVNLHQAKDAGAVGSGEQDIYIYIYIYIYTYIHIYIYI